MVRIWHHYTTWEDYQNGMYEEVKDDGKPERIFDSMNLLSDTMELEIVMSEVTEKWFYACQQFLTHKASNRNAWLGQAACCLAHGATESETRKAWNMLTIEQMEAANSVAVNVIRKWEIRHEKGIGNYGN